MRGGNKKEGLKETTNLGANLIWTAGNGDLMQLGVYPTRVTSRMEITNVKQKENLKQGLVSAKDLTLVVPERRYLPYHILD